MKKQLRIITNVILIVALLMVQFVSGISTAYAQTENVVKFEKSNVITLNEATVIATDFMEANMAVGEEEKWNDDAWIESYYECVDTNENISAYIFNISDNVKKCGYVVVGASEVYAPIIEFGFEGEFYGYKFIEDNELLIYEGGMYYYVYNTITKLYYTCDAEKINVGKEDINQITMLNDSIKLQWSSIEELSNVEEAVVNAETVKTYGASAYEDEMTLYQANKLENCAGTDMYMINKIPDKFEVMNTYTKLSGIAKGCCSPVAALNALKCYFKYSSSYNSLMQSGEHEWTRYENTFRKLYSLMKTNSTGTTTGNIVSGLQTYLRKYTKYSNSVVKYLGMINFNAEEFVAELKANRPVIIETNNHVCYKNHSMVCIGLRSYTNGSLYYIIIDGHNNSKRCMNYAQGNAYSTEAISMRLFK